MSQLRRQGISATSLPTIKSKTITSANPAIAGLIAQCERKYLKAFPVNSPAEARTIFGDAINPSWYGGDAIKGFFDNIAPSSATLYIKSHVGSTGTVIDAVVASATINDTNSTPAPTLKIGAAYQGTDEYGVSGLRTGFKIVQGARFSTTTSADTVSGDSFVTLSSVSGVKVGDLVSVGATPLYIKVTSIDENAKKVFFTGTVGSVIVSGAVVAVCGFQLKTYRKSITGVETEVATDLGGIWCTMEPEVSQFYVQNVHSSNPYIKATDLSSSSALFAAWPATMSTNQYLTGGADGTAPSTSAHWAMDVQSFTNLPIRFLGNCETTDQTTQQAMETYCKSRDDMPKVIYNVPENRTKVQLLTVGQAFQRSDDVLGIIPAHWLTVSDPFASSSLAPDREIPNTGHIMGLWIRSITTLGIHYIPSINALPIAGITGVVGDQILDEGDRTDLCNAGINCIQYVSGSGYILRSAFTPSTATEFKFANGIFMRDFFKISFKDSLGDTQNEPNNMDRVKTSADAMKGYMFNLWTMGSTGNVPTGETFGQSVEADGVTPTTFDEHVIIQADIHNNPQSGLDAGERNLYMWFTYPAPAGSIKIGVGLMLR